MLEHVDIATTISQTDKHKLSCDQTGRKQAESFARLGKTENECNPNVCNNPPLHRNIVCTHNYGKFHRPKLKQLIDEWTVLVIFCLYFLFQIRLVRRRRHALLIPPGKIKFFHSVVILHTRRPEIHGCTCISKHTAI